MKPLLITSLLNIKIEGHLKNGLAIASSGVRIANNLNIVESDLDHYFHGLVGSIEYHHLKESNAICYKYSNNIGKKFDERSELVEFLYLVKIFQFILWIIKDNNVNCELGFTKFKDEKKTNVHSNFINVQNSRADGEEKLATFTREEIEAAIKIAERLIVSGPFESVRGTRLKKGSGRLSVFFYHLQVARNHSDLAFKVLSHCTALESLFSTATNELTHQLAERIAFFLSEVPAERLRIYKSIKEIYGFRSIVAHGETLTKKREDNLKKVSTSCDEFLRQIVKQILENENLFELFTDSKSDIDLYFMNLIFGINTIANKTFNADSLKLAG